MKVFGERLKELREEKELSSVQLGKAIEVDNTQILKWEKDKCSPVIDNLKKIAIFFNVSADYLIGLTDIKISLSPSCRGGHPARPK